MAIEKDFEVNPLADLLPRLPDAEFAELVADIQEHGLQEPAQLDAEGRILDGRNRYEACKEAKRIKAFKVRRWVGPASPEHYVRYILQHNILRRNLTAAQRAQVSTKLAEAAKRGRPSSGEKLDPKIGPADSASADKIRHGGGFSGGSATAKSLAKTAGVSVRTIERARQVQKLGPEAEQAVIDGTKTPAEVFAEQAAAEPEPEPLTDTYGNRVPDRSICTWNAATRELKEMVNQVRAIRRHAERYCEKNAVGWQHVGPHLKQLQTDLRNAATIFKFAMPHCVCCWCGGDGCKMCHRTGWLPKEVYQRSPRERKWKNDPDRE